MSDCFIDVPTFGSRLTPQIPGAWCAECLERSKYTQNGQPRCFKLPAAEVVAEPTWFEVITGIPLDRWMAIGTHEDLAQVQKEFPCSP